MTGRINTKCNGSGIVIVYNGSIFFSLQNKMCRQHALRPAVCTIYICRIGVEPTTTNWFVAGGMLEGIRSKVLLQ